jgi:folate-binding protein YgfZ
MLTNDVARLEDGAWMHAAFPNPQGRLIASCACCARRLVPLRHGGGHVRARPQVPRTLHARGRLPRARPDGRDRDALRAGRAREPRSSARRSATSGATVERGRVSTARFREGEVTLIRATHTAEDGFDLFVGASEARNTSGRSSRSGRAPAGHDALEVLRVEAGLPRYGVDASDANVVLEVVDESEAVSYTKGCYAGQEIIARIHWRGHVAKRTRGRHLRPRRGAARRLAPARLRRRARGGRITSTSSRRACAAASRSRSSTLRLRSRRARS